VQRHLQLLIIASICTIGRLTLLRYLWKCSNRLLSLRILTSLRLFSFITWFSTTNLRISFWFYSVLYLPLISLIFLGVFMKGSSLVLFSPRLALDGWKFRLYLWRICLKTGLICLLIGMSAQKASTFVLLRSISCF
jgi:hypothetical protein